jgi:hypothetical protein
MPRYLSMNARPSIPELDRIRRDIGARLRIEHAVTEPAPESLIARLKELATRVRDAKREKLFAEVDAQVAEVLRAAGRQPRAAHASANHRAPPEGQRVAARRAQNELVWPVNQKSKPSIR